MKNSLLAETYGIINCRQQRHLQPHSTSFIVFARRAATYKCQNTRIIIVKSTNKKAYNDGVDGTIEWDCRIATSREHCASNWKPQQLMKGLCQTTHSPLCATFFSSSIHSSSNFDRILILAKARQSLSFCSTKEMRKRGENYWILIEPENQVPVNAIRGQNKRCKCELFLRHFVFDMHGFRTNYARILDSKLDSVSLLWMPRVCVILKSQNRNRNRLLTFFCSAIHMLNCIFDLVGLATRGSTFTSREIRFYTQHMWSIWFVFICIWTLVFALAIL